MAKFLLFKVACTKLLNPGDFSDVKELLCSLLEDLGEFSPTDFVTAVTAVSFKNWLLGLSRDFEVSVSDVKKTDLIS